MDTLLQNLAEQGIVALLLALSITANYLMFKAILDLQEKRVFDAKEYNAALLEPMKALKQTADLILSIVQSMGSKKK